MAVSGRVEANETGNPLFAQVSRLANNEMLIGILFILPALVGFITFFAVTRDSQPGYQLP